MRQSYTVTAVILGCLASVALCVPQTNVVTLKGVLEAANAIRANPKSYAQVIETKIRSLMDSTGLHKEWRLKFNEGTKAVDEAIQFLKTASPLPPLVLNQGLTRNAWEHSKWQVEQNGAVMSHTGPAGRNSLTDRYNLYNDAASSNSWLENIADAQQNWYNTPELLCLQWIIDDGVPSRGHRNNILTQDALQVGVGIFPFTTKSGMKADRVTMFHSKNAPCSKCSSFPKEVNDKMCWSNFAAGSNSCDPENLKVAPTTPTTPVVPIKPEPVKPVEPV